MEISIQLRTGRRLLLLAATRTFKAAGAGETAVPKEQH